MSSLYLTPKLPFERIGFVCLALTVTTQKANARSSWTPCSQVLVMSSLVLLATLNK